MNREASSQVCLTALAAAALIGLSACGGDGAVDGGLEALDGSFTGDLVIEPDPPGVGEHRVEITLFEADGAPLVGAEVSISPWMPAHGHGSRDEEAEETEPGLYVSERVSFNMPGIWQLRVDVVKGTTEARLQSTHEAF